MADPLHLYKVNLKTEDDFTAFEKREKDSKSLYFVEYDSSVLLYKGKELVAASSDIKNATLCTGITARDISGEAVGYLVVSDTLGNEPKSNGFTNCNENCYIKNGTLYSNNQSVNKWNGYDIQVCNSYSEYSGIATKDNNTIYFVKE